MEKGDEKVVTEEATIHHIRITLTSLNVKNLEKGTVCVSVRFDLRNS